MNDELSSPTCGTTSGSVTKDDTIKLERIGLMGRVGKATVTETLRQIYNQVVQLGLTPLVDDETASFENLNIDNMQTVSRESMGTSCDLVIVVGGDGSILHAGRALAAYDVPVIGVNRGRLGFLADVNPDEVYSKLQNVLNGEYKLDRRFLLQMVLKDASGNRVYEAMALNDIVLHAGKSVHMIDFEMCIDGQYVYRQHSDGLIMATPTGSTAYALSAGGPIMHPSMDAISLVPLNPHALSSRPVVINGDSEIEIRIHADNRMQPMVSADGQTSVPIVSDHTLHIRKHPDKLTLLHPPGYDFYAACRTKLGWNASGFDE